MDYETTPELLDLAKRELAKVQTFLERARAEYERLDKARGQIGSSITDLQYRADTLQRLLGEMHDQDVLDVMED